MIAGTADIIENIMTVPLPVTPKLPEIIATVSKPEKDCINYNYKSNIPIQQETLKFYANSLH